MLLTVLCINANDGPILALKLDQIAKPVFFNIRCERNWVVLTENSLVVVLYYNLKLRGVKVKQAAMLLVFGLVD